MKKTIKMIRNIILILLAVLLIFTLVVYIVHHVRTNEEFDILQKNGLYNPVSVGNYSLNVAKFGNKNGEHVIVGMAGIGMGDCSVSMRQMTECLEEDNLVVFVDRAGYGLSDDTNHEMTLEYIVEDYRKALKNAGLEGPYILMPHSIGGAYATYWCSQYPDEIEAVVFVDGSQLSENSFVEESDEYRTTWEDYILAKLAKLGFSRFVLRNYYYHYPPNYSDEEQYLGDALSLMTADSIATISECDNLAANAQKAFNTIMTNEVPKLYICASWGYQTEQDWREYVEWVNEQIEINNLPGGPKKTDFTDEEIEKVLSQAKEMRKEILVPYLEKMGKGELVCLGGDHMIYEQKPVECGEIIEDFIDGLDN